MSKHTPGPWHTDLEDSGLFNQDTCRFWINAEGLMHVGYVDGPRTEERNANARLIAAAPELLEALEAVAEIWNHHCFAHGDGVPTPCHAKVRAAIAKAKGEA